MSARKYEGVGGFAPGSHDIPIIDAALYVGLTVGAILAAYRVALWIGI